MTADDRLEHAQIAYEQAVFGGAPGVLDGAERALDALEADTALARGRLLHARFLDDRQEDPRELELFELAARRYAELGDPRGEGEAIFWIGTFHQVVRGGGEVVEPLFARSLELATTAGDKLTQSYALRHLAFVAQLGGRPGLARERLEESSQLRREVGFLPGVAANMIGLAFLAVQDGRRADALSILDDAETLARDSAAFGTLKWVEEARAEIAAG
jgi:hypothetical protein